ncbi:MAG: tRNA (cytosine(32)/uridine(32)-2'-O)-methyltransferase TrmJ [Gammaproteobacteria bacterium]|nr:tRNA (cytosine(32)/uridine(32)-2'-O)-methyltransferase TrmJ [Gammaproteobacteria bacterium]
MYQKIRVVLVNPSHPGNIGAVARAMKTMALAQLVIVAPQRDPFDSEARARAAGALDVLLRAQVVEQFEQAISDCGLVVGASARLRTIPWPTFDPHQCAQQVVATARHDAVALVFGREDTGLTNDELARCQRLVHIPANPDYSSLNLASAVQVITYEIRMAELAAGDQSVSLPPEQPLATAAELQGLYQHLEKTLQQIGFYDPANPRQLMRRLRRLFNRAQLDKMEMNILRGILAAVDEKHK